MRYTFMLFIAFSMALISSVLTALGMSELFSGAGKLILCMFVLIDLGRFLLFNFVVDEWNNLRKVKYFIVFIISLLFIYSGIGIFSKLDSLMSTKTKEAMINIASVLKEESNANIKQDRSQDLAKIAQDEYKSTMDWNNLDYQNCLKRAGKNANAENNCNNTKRRLDKAASTALQESLAKADEGLNNTAEVIKQSSINRSEVSSVILTICKLSGMKCDSYDELQIAVSIIIFLVIIGTDYLQIAIVLAVNTRKNKKNVTNKSFCDDENVVKKSEKYIQKIQELDDKIEPSLETKIDENVESSEIILSNNIENKISEKEEQVIEKTEKNVDPKEENKRKFTNDDEFFKF